MTTLVEIKRKESRGNKGGSGAEGRKRRKLERDHAFDHIFLGIGVGRIFQRGVSPSGAVKDTLAMGQEFKSVFAIVCIETRCADATERHVRDGDLHDAFVDGGASRASAREDGVDFGLVFGKDVEGEGFGSRVDKVDKVVDARRRKDRKNGAKYFVLHEGKKKKKV